MLLKVPFEQALNTAAKGEVEGKKVNFFLRIGVRESTLDEALDKFGKTKTVVGFDYEGTADFLYGKELPENRIFVTKQVEDLGPSVDFVVKAYPSGVRVILQVPEDFTDMRAVMGVCSRYANVRVDGGSLLRLPGVRIGAVDQEDFVKKIAESRVPLVSSGDAGIMASVDISDVDNLEFYEGKISEKKTKEARPVKDTLTKLERVPAPKSQAKTKTKPSPKRPSFVSQEKIGGLGNF